MPSTQELQERREWGGSGPLRKFLHTSVKQEGAESERKLKFIISTDSLDRDGDTISPDGWQLDNFKRNPVVLFGHDYRSLPVARAVDTRVEGGALVSVAKFATAEEYPFADSVYRMYKGGFMRAVSVGFLPVEWKQAEDQDRPHGLHFLKQELLEYSCVPVPSNPDALAASAGGRRSLSGAGRGRTGISEAEREMQAWEQRRQRQRDAYRRQAGLAPAGSAGPRSDAEIPVDADTVRRWMNEWFAEATGSATASRGGR